MLKASVLKEFKLVFRDIHSVLVLFAMPAVFIIIMSLAMQDQFSNSNQFSIAIHYAVEKPNERIEKFLRHVQSNVNFTFTEISSDAYYVQQATGSFDKEQATILIPADTFDPFEDTAETRKTILINLAPTVDARTRLLIYAAVKEAYAKTTLADRFAVYGGISESAIDNILVPKEGITAQYLTQQGSSRRHPTAVQQSVPAWLIFSMFFVVIPIATTLITERQQGTLTRLRTMPVSMSVFLLTKLLPYLVINQVQLLIMLMIGLYLIPLLGGDQLIISGSISGLIMMSLAVGVAAVGWGLLVAVVVKSVEQATAVGGVGNILLGAIGGIMVPKFIMPLYMQDATYISPMAWGLDGFLDVLLRGGGVNQVIFEASILLLLGSFLILTAIYIFYKRH